MSSFNSILKWAKEAKFLLKKGTAESLAGVKTNLSMIVSQATEEVKDLKRSIGVAKTSGSAPANKNKKIRRKKEEVKKEEDKQILKFGDMPYGTIFHEYGKVGKPRRFIKVQDFLPSGLKSINYRRAVGVIGDREYKEEDQPLLPFNSVDLDNGCTANCPDWLEFVVDELGPYAPHIEDRRKANGSPAN